VSGPILNQHDHSQIIGKWGDENGSLVFELFDGHEKPQYEIHNIFGGAGFEVLEMVDREEKILIKKGRIREFSFDPNLVWGSKQ